MMSESTASLFTFSVNGPSSIATDTITAALQTLSRGLNGSHFGSFFWTSSSLARNVPDTVANSSSTATSSPRLSNGSIDVIRSNSAASAFPSRTSNLLYGHDQRRKRLWLKLSQVLDSFTRSGNDICKLSQARTLTRKKMLLVSLKGLHEMEDKVVAASCLAQISSLFSMMPEVALISLGTVPRIFNFHSRSIQESANVGFAQVNLPYTSAGITGANQVVSLADTGVDVTSCYFSDGSASSPLVFSDPNNPNLDLSQRKVVQYVVVPGSGDNGDDYSGHGTHVAGTILGSVEGQGDNDIFTEGSPSTYNGIAPDAKLAFMDCGNSPDEGIGLPSTASQTYGPGYSAGARVHSNSWGSGFSSYYQGSDTDNYLYQNQNFLILFAAGNGGSDGRSSISAESSLKNVVGVGSSESTLDSTSIDYVAYYSSQGPTYDNRFKPDIVAPGDAIISALSNGANGPQCGNYEMTGTSMATPGAAGSALLIRQYFLDGRFWAQSCNQAYSFCGTFEPSGVLVKALLLHSGSSMLMFHGDPNPNVNLGPPPDFIQGYGRVSLFNILPLPGKYEFDLFVYDLTVLPENSATTLTVSVTSSSHPLKVTISWYDPPNQDGTTNIALLHDLDLQVTSPSNQVYYGNGGNRPDTLNNNEQVFVASPDTGDWTVTVSSAALPFSGNQAFSIVVTCTGTTNVGMGSFNEGGASSTSNDDGTNNQYDDGNAQDDVGYYYDDGNHAGNDDTSSAYYDDGGKPRL